MSNVKSNENVKMDKKEKKDLLTPSPKQKYVERKDHSLKTIAIDADEEKEIKKLKDKGKYYQGEEN